MAINRTFFNYLSFYFVMRENEKKSTVKDMRSMLHTLKLKL